MDDVGSPVRIDRCPCGEPLPVPTRKGGRARKYHNEACKKRAKRKRDARNLLVGTTFPKGHERTPHEPTARTDDGDPEERYYSDGGLDSYDDDSQDEAQIIADMSPRGVSVFRAPMSLGTKGDAADEWLALHDPETQGAE